MLDDASLDTVRQLLQSPSLHIESAYVSAAKLESEVIYEVVRLCDSEHTIM